MDFISSNLGLIILSILLIVLLFILIIVSKKKEWLIAKPLGLLDLLAIALLFACACGIILIGLIWIKPRPKETPDYHLVLSVTPDSTGFNAERFSFYSDSLISVINQHEKILEEKYDSFIQEKSDTLRMETVIGFLISIIVAIVGFFGYKSMKSIESKAVSLATENVEKEVKKYLASNLTDRVRQEMKANFITYLDEKSSNKIASQVKGEIESRLIEEAEIKIREDIIGYFTVGKNDDAVSISDIDNPFDKTSSK